MSGRLHLPTRRKASAEESETEPLVSEKPKSKPPSGGYISRKLNATAEKAHHLVDEGLHKVESIGPVNVAEKAKHAAIEKGLQKAGKKTLAILTADPWLPKRVAEAMTVAFRYTWPQIETFLIETLTEEVPKTARQREWPPPYERKEHPLQWFRASVLYALFPADATFWCKAREPLSVMLALAMLTSTFGISTWMWTLLLWLIDWDCEFQLINFIVLQRATIFLVVGLMWCALT